MKKPPGNQLMIWPDGDRAVPNALARSSLFNVDRVRAGGERAYLKQVTIASDDCVSVKYTGEQLRTDDEDVWLQLVHMSRDDLAQELQFTCRSMLNAIGWSSNSTNRERLKRTIYRLLGAQLIVEGPREGYASSLVHSFHWKDKSAELREWKVTLNRDLAKLFAMTYRTRIDWETRLSLSPIGKRLHEYVLSHRVPWPISLEHLREMCGSRAELKEWRRLVQAAMDSLVQAGAISSFLIANGFMTWKRKGDDLVGVSM